MKLQRPGVLQQAGAAALACEYARARVSVAHAAHPVEGRE